MNQWKKKEPQKGDHIRVFVNEYYHHGIYIGNNEVVQFGYPNNVFQKNEDVKVVRTTLEEFHQGKVVEVCFYDELTKMKLRNPDDIVSYAICKLGEGGYDVLHNNCEHFATECTMGTKKSEQIELIRQQIAEKLGKKK